MGSGGRRARDGGELRRALDDGVRVTYRPAPGAHLWSFERVGPRWQWVDLGPGDGDLGALWADWSALDLGEVDGDG